MSTWPVRSDALILELLQRLDVPHTRVRRVFIEFCAGEVGVMTIERYVDEEDHLLTTLEKYKLVAGDE